MALVLAFVALHAPTRAVAPGGDSGEAIVVLTNVLDPNGQALCGGDFADADAMLRIRQRGGQTRLAMRVRNARPDTAYSVWLRLADLSPFTGLPFTAAVHTADVPGLIPITPDAQLLTNELGPGDDGIGGPVALNGFYTDSRGNGEWNVTLDFPLVGGAYQWQRVSSQPRSPFDDSPFLLAVASHCSDNLFHGLAPGAFELWWLMTVSPF